MYVTLSLHVNDANTILGALGKFPCEQVFDLVVEIRKQVADQMKKAAEIVPSPPPT